MDILEKYLKNNRKVEIELFCANNTPKTFKTGFYKVLEDKYIIYKPQMEDEFHSKQQLKVLVYTNAGIFVFETKIISLNSKIIEIEKPKNYRTIQRRELLRAELAIPFVLNKRKHSTKNISGSGFSFYCDEILDKNTNFDIELVFEDRKISSKIKIIEIRKNLKNNLPKYRYSVKMLSLNKIDENYIIKQCIINNMQSVNI